MKIIKTAVSFSDARGEILDLIENDLINAVTIVTFKQGAVRGNHYHKDTTQYNYLLSGKIKLVCQVPGGKITETIMDKGDFIVTLPNERHALVGLEDAELLVLTRGPRGGKEYESDTFRLETPLVR
jgi:quercetin dioxygenase-like cupin family protein